MQKVAKFDLKINGQNIKQYSKITEEELNILQKDTVKIKCGKCQKYKCYVCQQEDIEVTFVKELFLENEEIPFEIIPLKIILETYFERNDWLAIFSLEYNGDKDRQLTHINYSELELIKKVRKSTFYGGCCGQNQCFVCEKKECTLRYIKCIKVTDDMQELVDYLPDDKICMSDIVEEFTKELEREEKFLTIVKVSSSKVDYQLSFLSKKELKILEKYWPHYSINHNGTYYEIEIVKSYPEKVALNMNLPKEIFSVEKMMEFIQ